MPMYQYKCKCGNEFSTYAKMEDDSSKAICSCGKEANKVFTAPYLKTDTSFCMTGKRDSRLDNEVIEGRDHWNRKLKEKGYVELTQGDLNSY